MMEKIIHVTIPITQRHTTSKGQNKEKHWFGQVQNFYTTPHCKQVAFQNPLLLHTGKEAQDQHLGFFLLGPKAHPLPLYAQNLIARDDYHITTMVMPRLQMSDFTL
jgi:hypothetical protein